MSNEYELDPEQNSHREVIVYGFEDNVIATTIVDAIVESEAREDIFVNMPVMEINATFGELFMLVQRQLPKLDYVMAFAISKLLMQDSREIVAFKRRLGLPEMLCSGINSSNVHLLTTFDYIDETSAEVKSTKLPRSPILDSILKENSKFVSEVEKKIEDFKKKGGRKSRGESRSWLDEEFAQWSEVFTRIESSLNESLVTHAVRFDKRVVFSFIKFDKPYSKADATVFFDNVVIAGFPSTKIKDGVRRFENVLQSQIVNSLITYKQIRKNLGLSKELNFPHLPETLLKMVYPMKTNIENVFRCLIGTKEYYEPVLEYSIDLARKKFEMNGTDFAYWYVANVYYQTLYRDYVVNSLRDTPGSVVADYPMSDKTQSKFLEFVYTYLPKVHIDFLMDTFTLAMEEDWTNERLLSALDIRHVREA